MPLLLGTDEAGYGPNLGPLVIGATLWHVPEWPIDLYQQLAPLVQKELVPSKQKKTPEQIAVADSKQLYQSGGTLESIETSLLAFLTAVSRQREHADIKDESTVASWLGDGAEQASDFKGWAEKIGWVHPQDLETAIGYDWEGLAFPKIAKASHARQVGENLAQVFDEQNIQCLGIWVETLFPDRFNAGLEHRDNKATLLSTETCALVRRLLDQALAGQDFSEVQVICDKHGGRSKYAALIQESLTECLVTIREESRSISRYAWQEGGVDIDLSFIARGEQQLPVALASMAAKYTRERVMEAWNAFWKKVCPEIRPTAGYPQDARRFKLEIETVQQALGVTDQQIWRKK